MPRKDFYKNKPISSLESLCKVLRLEGLSSRKLLSLARNADSRYRVAKEFPKKKGVRLVYDVKEPLKSIQKAIHDRIFGSVNYPDYLSGGIRGRSTKTHATPHVGASVLINLDVENFFPSVTQNQVRDLFQYGFQFAPGVAEVMAKLLTHKGVLPQGASTSADVANLILFKVEPRMVERLQASGFGYGRFIDDMSVSSRSRKLANDAIEQAISTIISSVEGNGFKMNRQKQTIAREGQQKITVGRLVNRTLSIPKSYEQSAWAAVLHAEKLLKEKCDHASLLKAVIQAQGKINYLAEGRSSRARRLARRLEAVKQCLPVAEGYSERGGGNANAQFQRQAAPG